MQDDQVVDRGDRVSRDFAVITKFDGGEPWISAERDPRCIDPVRAKCVGDPLRDHDRDHDRKYV